MNVLIAEDEPLGRERLIKLLGAIDPAITVRGEVATVKSAVEWLRTHPAPDLIFLDIELADGQCFEIFRQVEVEAPVIFTTSYDEYALHAFQVNSVDYLLKPVRREELARALEKYGRLRRHFARPAIDVEQLIAGLRQAPPPPEYRSRFLVRQGQRLLSVEVSDVAWFHAEGKLCFLRTWENQRYLLDYTLEELSGLLDPREFFRVSRSYLVRARAVRVIHSYFHGKLMLELSPPAEQKDVVVSKERAGEFKRWMGK